MSTKRRRPSRELHDAFENDVDLDVAGVAVGEGIEAPPEIAETRGEEGPRRELIERIRPSEMIPDRFQPRPILPFEIYKRFYAGEIDCYGAAQEWLQLAEGDKGHSDRVAELMAMADSVDEHGQIKPITGSWVTRENGRYVFQIETGERRFWGACLKSVSLEQAQKPLLRVEAVEAPSVERQIIENRHAQPPTAVAQAREIAALLLSRMGHHPDPSLEDPYDYFRQALDPPGRERLPRGVWNKIEPVMQLTPRRMSQVLSVLQMPTELLEQADRYDLSDRVLQAVLAQPEKQWPALVRAAVEQGLTGEELTTAAVLDAAQPTARPKRRAKPRDHPRSALRGLRGFSGALARAGEKQRVEVLGVVADEVVVQENVAQVVDMLEQLLALLRVRMEALEETRR